MSEILSRFKTLTKGNFIKIQILKNAKEHDCTQSICRMVINVLQSMIIYFRGLTRLKGKGLEYVAQMTPRFGWPRNY